MLYNPIYSGVASYNEREWRKLPGTNKRRYRKRKANELIQVTNAELRLIDEGLPRLRVSLRLRLRRKTR